MYGRPIDIGPIDIGPIGPKDWAQVAMITYMEEVLDILKHVEHLLKEEEKGGGGSYQNSTYELHVCTVDPWNCPYEVMT